MLSGEMSARTLRQRPTPSPAGVLAKAVPRAARALGVAQKELAHILGVSEASTSRLVAGQRALDPESKEGELALLFLRVFRGLDALVGGRAEAAREWFRAENAHLGGAPAERVATVEGLVHVAEYLDAMRGKL
jgi:Antitoxin Xre/MbcA/ParS C-terminal toxin-binding domain/Antitoxin Xre-like helix-turn-helix domain